MKKINVITSLSLFLISTLISCNNQQNSTSTHKQIPPNSIYQEGDIVYTLDTLMMCDKNWDIKQVMRIDGFTIYRAAKHEMIYDIGIGKGALTDFILNGYPKDTNKIQHFVFDMQGEKGMYRDMIIQSNNIIAFYSNFDGDKSYYIIHVSSIDQY